MNAYSLMVVRRRFRGATGAGYACWVSGTVTPPTVTEPVRGVVPV